MFTNRYIFTYAAVMVIVVAAILSFAATVLKPYQEKNVRTEKIMDILKSVNIESDKSNAEELYDKYITEELAITPEGEVVSLYKTGSKSFEKGDIRPFDINMKVELSKLEKLKSGKGNEKPVFPLYVCSYENKTYYIIPLRGKGLWGPIWGNISLLDDFKTVYGVTFGHKGETPGLGAEIATSAFQKQFAGKTIFDDSYGFTSVKVVKGGAATLPANEQIHGVDAISGGTITSNSVTEMLKVCLENYVPYIKQHVNN
jgi:Na+-transporting NADH:ubiquinone oxidoreductase subunit C